MDLSSALKLLTSSEKTTVKDNVILKLSTETRSNPDLCRKILCFKDNTVLRKLIQATNSRPATVRKALVCILCNCSHIDDLTTTLSNGLSSEELVSRLIDDDIVEFLVDALSVSDNSVIVAAATALGNLSCDFPLLRSEVRAAGGIEDLAELLKTSKDRVIVSVSLNALANATEDNWRNVVELGSKHSIALSAIIELFTQTIPDEMINSFLKIDENENIMQYSNNDMENVSLRTFFREKRKKSIFRDQESKLSTMGSENFRICLQLLDRISSCFNDGKLKLSVENLISLEILLPLFCALTFQKPTTEDKKASTDEAERTRQKRAASVTKCILQIFEKSGNQDHFNTLLQRLERLSAVEIAVSHLTSSNDEEIQKTMWLLLARLTRQSVAACNRLCLESLFDGFNKVVSSIFNEKDEIVAIALFVLACVYNKSSQLLQEAKDKANLIIWRLHLQNMDEISINGCPVYRLISLLFHSKPTIRQQAATCINLLRSDPFSAIWFAESGCTILFTTISQMPPLGYPMMIRKSVKDEKKFRGKDTEKKMFQVVLKQWQSIEKQACEVCLNALIQKEKEEKFAAEFSIGFLKWIKESLLGIKRMEENEGDFDILDSYFRKLQKYKRISKNNSSCIEHFKTKVMARAVIDCGAIEDCRTRNFFIKNGGVDVVLGMFQSPHFTNLNSNILSNNVNDIGKLCEEILQVFKDGKRSINVSTFGCAFAFLYSVSNDFFQDNRGKRLKEKGIYNNSIKKQWSSAAWIIGGDLENVSSTSDEIEVKEKKKERTSTQFIERSADVCFVIGEAEEKFYAHTNVLVNCSSVFSRLVKEAKELRDSADAHLYDENANSEDGAISITITNVQYDVFVTLISFIYTHDLDTALEKYGKLATNSQECVQWIFTLLDAAEEFQVQTLHKMLIDYLRSSVHLGTAISILQEALQRQMMQLSQYSFTFVVSNIFTLHKKLLRSAKKKKQFIEVITKYCQFASLQERMGSNPTLGRLHSFIGRHRIFTSTIVFSSRYFIGDGVVQCFENYKKPVHLRSTPDGSLIDFRRSVIFGIFGVLYGGGLGHFFYTKVYPWASQGAVATALFDVLIQCPFLYMPLYYCTKQFVVDRLLPATSQKPLQNSLVGAYDRWKRNFAMDLRNLMVVWLPLHTVNFYFIPVRYRMAFMSGAGIFWVMLLSATRGSLSSGEEEEEETKTELE
eukprot:g5333.t1